MNEIYLYKIKLIKLIFFLITVRIKRRHYLGILGHRMGHTAVYRANSLLIAFDSLHLRGS